MISQLDLIHHIIKLTKKQLTNSELLEPVSYTHLDVYKRQLLQCRDRVDQETPEPGRQAIRRTPRWMPGFQADLRKSLDFERLAGQFFRKNAEELNIYSDTKNIICHLYH